MNPLVRYNEGCQELMVTTDKAYYQYPFVSPEWYETIDKIACSRRPNDIWKILNKPFFKKKCIKTERKTK